MAKNDYLKKVEADYLGQHDQFKAAAHDVGANVGFTAADLTAIDGDNSDLHAAISASNIADAVAQQKTKAKQTTIKNAKARHRALAQQAKKNPNYTPAIGEQMKIEGEEDTTDLSNSKPTLTGKALPHSAVNVGFDKGRSHGVSLYSQRGDETAMTPLATDRNSPYVDNRAPLVAGKPEVRKYTAIYLLGDDEVGLVSDVLTVVTQP
ncbi:MAG: hypothetical protein HY300_16510 [Verrucomicrobia bacterium]|nr:hypothetical protein [Verrucomicrobiota bacterium]